MIYEIQRLADKAEWLKARKTGLTGTEIGAIMGWSPYMTALDVFNNKLYDTQQSFTDDQKRKMYWGSRLEKIVMEEFFNNLDYAVNDTQLNDFDLFQSSEHGFMIGTPDSIFTSSHGLEVLEVKTTGYLGKGWGDEYTDQMPMHYKMQLAWYVMITDAVRGHLAVLVGGQQVKYYVYKRDQKLEKAMLEAGKSFWHNHVQLGLPPMPQNEKDLQSLYPKADPEKTTMAPRELKHVLEELKEVKSNISGLEDRKKELEYEVKSFLGDAAIMLDEAGKELVTYKNQTRNSFDSTEFKKDYPELHAKYMKASSFRKFELKEKNI